MRLEDLPEVLTLAEAAEFFRVSKITIYRDPKRFGGKRIRGKLRWMFARQTVLKLAGVPT